MTTYQAVVYASLKNGTDLNGHIADSNHNINLRKAANHPLLFQRHFSPSSLSIISKALLVEREFEGCDNISQVMQLLGPQNDFELGSLCEKYSKRLYSQGQSLPWALHMESGKMAALIKLLQDEILPMTGTGNYQSLNKVLIFSQFTSLLNILEHVLTYHGYLYYRLDGSTPVEERQQLVDDFNKEADENYNIFLLSSKAAGCGINLTAANYVILYDVDYNPQNEKQAEDRCHRIGQEKIVNVIRMVAKDTVEEDILKMSMLKMKLDNEFI